MANSKLLLNDGSFLLLNDGSKILLNDGSNTLPNNGSFLLLNDGSKILLNDGSKILLNNGSNTLPNCKLLLNNGSNILLNNGSNILLNDASCTDVVGGSSGGISKKYGVQLTNDPGKRKIKYKKLIRVHATFIEKLQTPVLIRSGFRDFLEKSIKIQHTKSQILERKINISASFREYGSARIEAISKFKEPLKGKIEISGWKDTRNVQKIINMYHAYKIRKLEKRYETFEIDFSSFTHSSSFVGNVRYDNDTGEMTIILGGKTYSFCNVPRRIFDGFRGASSKGAYFARNIKGQFNC